MLYILLAMLCLFLVYICYSDIRHRKISNALILAIAVISLLIGRLIAGEVIILPALCLLLIGFLLSTCRVFGAGDAKLLVALSLSLSSEATLVFLFLTSLAGLPVALLTLINNHYRKNAPHKTVPYGVAIAVGYMATMLSQQGPL